MSLLKAERFLVCLIWLLVAESELRDRMWRSEKYCCVSGCGLVYWCSGALLIMKKSEEVLLVLSQLDFMI